MGAAKEEQVCCMMVWFKFTFAVRTLMKSGPALPGVQGAGQGRSVLNRRDLLRFGCNDGDFPGPEADLQGCQSFIHVLDHQ
jgi:hypothetical protein